MEILNIQSARLKIRQLELSDLYDFHMYRSNPDVTSINQLKNMYLYRIISEEEWITTKKENKVPRCKSDQRDNCVHLNKYEDVILVTNKYFVRDENPVVLEIDISDFESRIVWKEPTVEKPWYQPNADIENIEWRNIKMYSYLIPHVEKENEFMIGSFLKSEGKDAVDF